MIDHNIYSKSLSTLMKKGYLKKTDSILVVAGGSYDREIMIKSDFKNVTISNIDFHAGHTDYTPYKWIRIDAEKIEANDNSYDWAVIHAGLHHLAIPALGVCEMFRVAKKGILCIEARDSFFMRLAVKFGLTSDYELEPALLSGGSIGGYRNGAIPNYIYRWKEREFEKTINSFAPTHKHKFIYLYDIRLPIQRYAMAKNPLISIILWILLRLKNIIKFFFPKQGNEFAFVALKNIQLQPWLTASLDFDETFLSKKYDKNKYPGYKENIKIPNEITEQTFKDSDNNQNMNVYSSLDNFFQKMEK
ncbi:MAG TPA: methyltransferase domain-containing protein [Spirochaetota bacterium]|nr:methyltransferase domain-containing protein [Spirochaetota bacterium]HOS31662.1 methyltransferase domain-containing protein [Spirochaetota bacterium]HOS56073.1 methyltransferase domain-containing protein [Spirochaetota bacterium]HPK61213.1 methyltransferase domain-containing protein [Spirochaetota bacterium]HQF77228.1 methyltransferase domain-containing protein [Spirochaetota bacterium]